VRAGHVAVDDRVVDAGGEPGAELGLERIEAEQERVLDRLLGRTASRRFHALACLRLCCQIRQTGGCP
jgi:hypothetical protein